MRGATFGALALAMTVAAAAVPAQAMDGATVTRIEPRPFYGAVITIEEGVRVFRPLPPHKRIVINPTNAPVDLSFNETTERSYNYSYSRTDNFDHSSSSSGCCSDGSIGAPLDFGHDGGKMGKRKNGVPLTNRHLKHRKNGL